MSENHQLHVLVTGGTRGIGAAICAELKDHHLYVGGRHEADVTRICATLPHAQPFVCDLAEEAQVAAACAQIQQLDVLVLNAAIATAGKIANLTHHDWEQILSLNVVAQADLLRHLLPQLRASRGLVVSINSGAGYVSSAGNGAYAASKFALRALTDALREEERGRVRVTSIHPGRVDTDMQVALQQQTGRPYCAADHMPAQAVARAVRTALEMPANAVVETLSVRPQTLL